MTIEEMRAELEAAEYDIHYSAVTLHTGTFSVTSPDGWKFESSVYPQDDVRVQTLIIETGYRHLQEKRQFESMEASISELRGVLSHCLMTLKRTMYTETSNDIEAAIDRAEKILYKKNNEL
jgi:hypothetical protein